MSENAYFPLSVDPVMMMLAVAYTDGLWGGRRSSSRSSRGRSSSRSRSPARSRGGWSSRRGSRSRSTFGRTRSRGWSGRRSSTTRSTSSRTRRGWSRRKSSSTIRTGPSRIRTGGGWFTRRRPSSRSTFRRTRGRWSIRRYRTSTTGQNKGKVTSSGVTKKQLKDMKTVITKFETIGGKPNLKVYKDSKGRNAIGVGFDLDQPDAKKVFQKTLPGVSFDKVKAGKQSITAKQASKLLDHEMKSKIATARRIVKTFDKAPGYVKTAVVNAVYRGELKSTHKTVKLMNQGKWKQAAKEYVNHKGYKDASKPGSKSPGIKTRMDYNAKQFEKYGKELEKKG